MKKNVITKEELNAINGGAEAEIYGIKRIVPKLEEEGLSLSSTLAGGELGELALIRRRLAAIRRPIPKRVMQ